ncbi:AraC family transcriptional regulator [Pseudomonas sp. 6D_7.1_Bac1]|uniref:AraC family transcriptional regulator n=1 Tax=Pseudomonas sp. 6D_7.1_Bac1 TaxID=2971615 RepID=UPI0021C7EBFC|nr:AraC family transcriptional regulator [Pseudomonas sp. 6D_7.1_Bac1]MCU1752747.1 AraC family transcriptional regulator [Pseudomonas sp. 6D_7.1_Bac1]
MSLRELIRGPASALLLVEFGREKGLSPAQLLAGSGLSLTKLSDPNFELSCAQELRLINNLLNLLGHPRGLGYEVGARYHFSIYGLFGYGLISSATAGDALKLALRFLPLTYAFTRIAYHEEHTLGVLTFAEPELADESIRHFVIERDMSAAAVLLKEIAGSEFSVARFTLKKKHPVDQSASSAGNILGVRPDYLASSNSLAFDRSLLSRPLPQANTVTVSMCEQMCAQLMERRIPHTGTATLVRQYLNITPLGTPPDLPAMANLINISERTLKRRLHDEGTSYRHLLAQSRSSAALALLNDPGIKLTDIAEKLGYSDLSSFSQTFKRWYGVSPRTYRNDSRAKIP